MIKFNCQQTIRKRNIYFSENILFNGRVLSVVISVAAQYYTTRVEGSQDPGDQHHLHHLHHQQEGILCDHRDYVSVILIWITVVNNNSIMNKHTILGLKYTQRSIWLVWNEENIYILMSLFYHVNKEDKSQQETRGSLSANIFFVLKIISVISFSIKKLLIILIFWMELVWNNHILIFLYVFLFL